MPAEGERTNASTEPGHEAADEGRQGDDDQSTRSFLITAPRLT